MRFRWTSAAPWPAKAIWLVAVATAILGPWAAQLAHAEPGGLPEYQVKAAFLYNFAKFVEWPADKFPRADSPVVVGVVGDDPFGQTLAAVIQNKTINHRPLLLRRVVPGDGLEQCHILFVGRSETPRLEEILAAVKGAAVLTVGETEQFLERGGMINFFLESDNVKFAINGAAAERAGLKLSSKLLAVARVVKTEPSR